MSEPKTVVVDQKLPFPEGYTTDLHTVELTRAQIDMLVFAAASVLGYVDDAVEAQGMLPEGQTYAPTETGANLLDDAMNVLLDKSESFR